MPILPTNTKTTKANDLIGIDDKTAIPDPFDDYEERKDFISNVESTNLEAYSKVLSKEDATTYKNLNLKLKDPSPNFIKGVVASRNRHNDKSKFNIDDHPVLKSYVQSNPVNKIMLGLDKKENYENLFSLSDHIKNIKYSYQKANVDIEKYLIANDIRTRVDNGLTVDKLNYELAELDSDHFPQLPPSAIKTFTASAAGSAAHMVDILSSTLWSGSLSAAGGFAVPYVLNLVDPRIASKLTPYTKHLPGIAGGVPAFLRMRRIFVGEHYYNHMRNPDVDLKRLSREANVAGTVKAILEVTGLVNTVLPAPDKFLRLFGNSKFGKFMGNSLFDGLGEGVVEATQAIIDAVANAVSSIRKDEKLSLTNFNKNIDYKQSAKDTLISGGLGMAVGTLFGFVPAGIRTIISSQKAKHNKDNLTTQLEQLRKVGPAVEDLNKKQWQDENGISDKFKIDAREFEEFINDEKLFQKGEISPLEFLSKVGVDEELYTKAVENNEFISLDSSTIMSTLAVVNDRPLDELMTSFILTDEDGTSLGSELLRVVKTARKSLEEGKTDIDGTPEELLDNEINQAKEEIAKDLEALTDFNSNILTKLHSLNLASRDIKRHLNLITSFIKTISNRTDMSLREFLDTFDLDIKLADKQTDDGEVVKGFYVGDKGSGVITLTPDANDLTVVHEMSHWFYAVMKQLALNNEQIAEDMRIVDEELKGNVELFSNLFESYIYSNKVPDKPLRKVFNQMRVWLSVAHEELTGLDEGRVPSNLNNILNRMLFMDRDIDRLVEEEGTDIEFTFKELDNIGKKIPEGLKEFKKTVDDEFKTLMWARAEKQYKRALNKKIKNLPKSLVDKVKSDLASNRRYQAYYHLFKGKLRKGDTFVPSNYPSFIRLNEEDVFNNYRQYYDVLKKKGLLKKKSPSTLEEVASIFDFDNEEVFFQEMSKVDFNNDLKYTLENLVGLTDKEFNLESVYNELIKNEKAYKSFYKKLYTQLPYSNKDLYNRIEGISFRDIRPNQKHNNRAKRLLGKQKLSDINSKLYIRNIRKSSMEGGKVKAKGDVKKALEYKNTITANKALEKEAVKIEAWTKKAIKDLKGIMTDKLASRTIGIGYQAQQELHSLAKALIIELGIVDADKTVNSLQIMDRLKQMSPRYKSLESIYDAFKKDNRAFLDTDVDTARLKYNFIRGLYNMARNEGEVQLKKNKKNIDEVATEMGSRLDTFEVGLNEAGLKDTTAIKLGEKAKLVSRSFASVFSMTEHVCKYFDRKLDTDIFTNNIFNVIEYGIDGDNINGGAEGYHDLMIETLKRLQSISEETNTPFFDSRVLISKLAGKIPKAGKLDANIVDSKSVRGIGTYAKFTREEFIMLLMNLGSEANVGKLLDTLEVSQQELVDWLDDRASDGDLTEGMVNLVNRTLQELENLYPQFAKAIGYYRGIAPEKRAVSEGITTPFGDIQGYFPLFKEENIDDDYNPLQPGQALDVMKKAVVNDDASISTSQAEHVKDIDYKIGFNPNSLLRAFTTRAQIIHLLNPGEYAYSIINHPKFKDGIRKFSPHFHKHVFKDFIDRAILQRFTTSTNTWGVKTLNSLRRGVQVKGMGINVASAIKQYAGIPLYIHEVGLKELGNTIGEAITDFKGMSENAIDKSSFMRSRGDTSIHDFTRTSLKTLNAKKHKDFFTKGLDIADKYSFFILQWAQWQVDVIGWNAMYYKQLEDGVTEVKAIREADSIVRRTQGSARPEHQSSILTDSMLKKIMMTFLSHTNSQFNYTMYELPIVASKENGVEKVRNISLFIASQALAPCIFVGSIAALWYGSDEERLKNLLKISGMEMLSSRSPIPFFGLDSLVVGRGNLFAPATIIGGLAKEVRVGLKALFSKNINFEEYSDYDVRSLNNIATVLTRVPIARAFEYVIEAYDAVVEEQSLKETGKALLGIRRGY